MISVKRPKELQENRKSKGKIQGVAFFWLGLKGRATHVRTCKAPRHTQKKQKGKKKKMA